MVESDRPAATGPENFEPATAGPPVSGLQPAPGGNSFGEGVTSIDLVNPIRCSSLTTTQKAVLLMVSWYARGTDGRCYASVPTLAADLSLSDRAVTTALKELVKAGWLKLLSAPYLRTRMYQVTVPASAPTARVNDDHPIPEMVNQDHQVVKDVHQVVNQDHQVVKDDHPDGEPASPDPGSDPVRDPGGDPVHHPEASLPLEAPTAPSKPKQSKEKNPFTEAWNAAWQQVATEKYPWPKPWHKVLALTKDLTVKPHSELVESASRFMKANGTPKFERWLYALKDETIRSAMGRKHLTHEEAMSLFKPELPFVEDHKPAPEPHKPPAYEAEILAARERRTKPKEVSRG